MEISWQISDGIAWFDARGECSLPKAVDAIRTAIAWCREQGIDRLLFDGRGFVGIPIPTLIDRFLMVEERAETARGMVRVVLVVHPEYIHPEKFGVKVAADFGLTADVYSSETAATAWLTRQGEA